MTDSRTVSRRFAAGDGGSPGHLGREGFYCYCETPWSVSKGNLRLANATAEHHCTNVTHSTLKVCELLRILFLHNKNQIKNGSFNTIQPLLESWNLPPLLLFSWKRSGWNTAYCHFIHWKKPVYTTALYPVCLVRCKSVLWECKPDPDSF